MAALLKKSTKDHSGRYIVCCMCGDTPQFSQDSYKLLFPGQPMPEMHYQPSIYKLLSAIDRNTDFYRYIQQFVNSKEKFSYFFDVDKDGHIAEQWDLLKGRKV